MLFSDLKEITGGECIHLQEDESITQLLLDSRRVLDPKGALFFAISGDRHDGHHFIEDCLRKGVRQFVVERTDDFPEKQIKVANIVRVDHTIDALQAIAGHHRKSFNIPVIGITGSNGKTIVKEWLYRLLSPFFRIAKSPQSYNSQVGVPLSVWQLSEGDELGIFEAGISQIGEMGQLEKIILPSIGILTNLGAAHDQGFEDREQKLREKLKLFMHTRQLIYCSDQKWVHQRVQGVKDEYQGLELVSWSLKNPEAGYYFHLNNKKLSFDGLTIDLPLNDANSVENLLHCITAGLVLGIRFQDLLPMISMISPMPMRLELRQGINSCHLIDDTYSNDLYSLNASLDFVSQQLPDKKKTVILSDILQSGKPTGELYEQVGKLLLAKGIHRLIGIGEEISDTPQAFQMKASFYPSTQALLAELVHVPFEQEAILIKGARVFHLEKVVNALEEKEHETRLEVDLNALINNLNFYRGQLRPGVKLMVMVKAFAYGGGSHEIASLLAYHKVDYLAVAYVDEGVELRKRGVSLPIMVLNVSARSYRGLIQYHLEPEVHSLYQLSRLIALNRDKQKLDIHLKIETGMNRLGFRKEDLERLIGLLNANPHISVKSVFSHLAVSENQNEDRFTSSQIDKFLSFFEVLASGLGYRPIRHILNSAGITRFKDSQMEMVRLGIGLHGIDNDPEVQKELLPVSTLKTIISEIKTINKGESVGYGRAFRATKETRVGVIAIGYADGYDRRLGNGKGKVLIGGQETHTLGHICMDMTMIDLAEVEAKEGDEVILFGSELPVQEIAKTMGTIPYEVLTNIGERVKRVYQYS